MTSLTLDTHLGVVDALEFGPRSSQVDLVLCIQGKSPNTDVVTEWHPLARLLQDKGIRVVVPNLHSNERTRPGTISQEDFDRLVLGALTQLKVKTLLCLCGKSWGGGDASPSLHPTAATSLMLIAPSLKETTAGMVSTSRKSVCCWRGRGTTRSSQSPRHSRCWSLWPSGRRRCPRHRPGGAVHRDTAC